jgi:hypothetical protein
MRTGLVPAFAALVLACALTPGSSALAQAAADRSRPSEPDRTVLQADTTGNAAPQSGAIPFKRDDEGGIGTGAAAGTAACLLLLGVWGTIQVRNKGQHSAGAAAGPWPGWWPLLGRAGARRERTLRVLETAALSPQVRLHVVTWRGKEYLVASSTSGARILDRGTTVSEPEPAVPAGEAE